MKAKTQHTKKQWDAKKAVLKQKFIALGATLKKKGPISKRAT